MKRTGSAVWQGGLKDGQGSVSSDSGALSGTPYSFASRFEQEAATNPEEMIAAAHASCFAMALSLMLGESGITPERVETSATVTIEPSDDGFTITSSHLDVRARIPGVDREVFETAANGAKAGCPISKALNVDITMDAKLEP